MPQERPRSRLEELRERAGLEEEEEVNPFLALSKPAPLVQTTIGTPIVSEDNPFAPYVGGTVQRPDPEEVVTAGARFVRGVGGGLVHPVRALIGEREEEDLGVAGVVGELVGAGLTFIPLYKGASIALKGVGLLKTVNMMEASRVIYFTPLGRTPAGLRGARIAQGALAFGGFEAFGGETVGEAPKRFVRGLAEGVAFEAAFAGIAAGWRAKFPKRRATGTGPAAAPPASTVPSEYAADPLAVSLEYTMHPRFGDSREILAGKITELGTHKEQVHIAFMNLVGNYMPGGQAIIPGLTQRDVSRLYKTASSFGRVGSKFARGDRFNILTRRKFKDDKLFEVLLIDMDRTLHIPEHLLDGKATIEEMSAAIRQQFDKLQLEFPDVIISRDPIVGRYTPEIFLSDLKPPKIEVATKGSKFKEGAGITTLVHEMEHHISLLSMAKNTGRRPRDLAEEVVTIRDVFRPKEGDAVWPAWKIFGDEIGYAKLRTELEAAQEEALAYYHSLVSESSLASGRKKAKFLIESKPDYYLSDDEMISQMAALIIFDSKKAKEIAPLAYMMVGDLIQEFAPTARELMTKEGKVMLDIFTDMWRMTNGIQTVWTKGSPALSKAAQKEWVKFGWAPGLRALIGGKDFEYLAKSGVDEVLVRSLDTGVRSTVPLSQLQRPVLQNIARRDDEIFRAIDGMLDEFPSEIPLNLYDAVPQVSQGTGFGGLRRYVTDVKDYEVIDGTVSDWVRGLPEPVQEQLINKFGQLAPRELAELELAPEGVGFINGVLDVLGKKGLVRRDGELIELFIKDRETLVPGSVIETTLFGAQEAGLKTNLVLRPSLDDWLKHQLRTKGVSEADLPYYYEQATRRLGERLENLADTEVRQVKANVEAALGKKKGKRKKGKKLEDPAEDPRLNVANDSPYEALSRAGIESERLPDGRRELRDSHSKSVLGTVADEDEALAYVNELTSHDVGTELGSFPGGTNHGGNGLPPRAGDPVFPNPLVFGPKGPVGEETLGAGSLLVDAATLFAPVFSAFENVARAAERHGLGPAYTKVFLPAQKAMMEVQAELSTVARDAFGGLTFKDKMWEMQKVIAPMSRKRHAAMTGYREAASKEEIARAGGLMARAMNPNELRASEMLTSIGMQHDVPRLMSTDRLITGAVKNKLPKVIAQMRQIELSPEAQQVLAFFESMPKFKTRTEVMDALGLTVEERKVIKLIRDSRGADKDTFSIMAVSRHASAPKLKKGFKNGKEQFAFENKVTRQEIEAMNLAGGVLDAGFLESGLDPKRFLTGYWPHLRMWTKEGHVLDKRLLPDDVVSWLGDRYRTGELNVYETDPMIGVYRQLRGLFMKKHFDPIMPDVKVAISATRKADSRIGSLMDEYVLELMGKPHASFDKLQSAVSKSMEVLLGKKPSDRLVNDIVSSLSALASAALIPFRAALIGRNYFESLLKVAPRVGVGYYKRALQYVVSPETRQEAFRMAMDAKAIRPGTTKLRSLHGAEEIFGPAGPRQLNKVLRMFDKGYEWYQSSDDWGRAIAFHAQRLRIMDNMPEYLRTGNLSKFKSQAKINTFDPLNIQIAEKHILNGDFDAAANHLGQKLAEETMTRYGFADHPAGWNSVQGRLFGQFGTWPVQYKDYLLQGLTRGSAKDRIEFTMIHAGISGSVVAAGAAVGINLKNWTGAGFYTGGPYADVVVDLVKSVSGSDLEKSLARRNLYGNIPILGWMETGNPRSILLPGSYLAGDYQNAMNHLKDGELFNAVMSGSGVRVMRPDEESPLKWLYRF